MPISSLSELQTLPTWTSRKTPVVCTGVIQETRNVKTFQFKSIDEQLFHFKPGQFIGIQLEIEGEKHNRSYTIASSPTRPHRLELTIKKEDAGKVSPWLHKNIQIGSKLELRGPAGKFNNLDIASEKVLLIGAGSGITPMMSMARFWQDCESSKNFIFLNWVHAVEDIIFRKELALMEFQNPNLTLEVICTQPGLKENWLGRRGRFNKNMLLDLVDDLSDRTIYCCGPDGFMQKVKKTLESLKFDMDSYHDESFDPGGKKKQKISSQKTIKTPSAMERKNGPFTLKLSQSKKEIIIEENEILLEKLESAGVDIDSGCRAGNCGACRVKKIQGETVTQNTAGLQGEEKIEGYILSCTTILKSDVILDI